MMEIVIDTAVLLFWGICGWRLFSLLRLPQPTLLGPLFAIALIRLMGYSLPVSPPFVSPLVQLVMGYYVGAKVTRDKVRELRFMVGPAVMIAAWVLSVAFALGSVIAGTSELSLDTAILGASLGGLPEMTVLAIALDANLPAIVVMHTLRMVITISLLPIIINKWLGGCCTSGKDGEANHKSGLREKLNDLAKHINVRRIFPSDILLKALRKGIYSFSFPLMGGYVLYRVGIPAGYMVGSMMVAAIISALGKNIIILSPNGFRLVLVGVGIMIADNISIETIAALSSRSLLLVIIISTLVIFASSLIMAFLIHKLFHWDFPTCVLAAAPSGFTVMIALAISYNRDSFRVSILHVCRLLLIKSVVPFVFYFLSR